MDKGLIPLLYTFFGSKDSINDLIAGTPTSVSGVGAGLLITSFIVSCCHRMGIVAIDKRGRIAIGSRFQIGGQDVRHQNEFVGQCTSFIDE